MIAKWKSKVNGVVYNSLEFSLCNKSWLYILHKMRIAKGCGVWYIVIMKKKEVSPKYSLS